VYGKGSDSLVEMGVWVIMFCVVCYSVCDGSVGYDICAVCYSVYVCVCVW
jgi:hypothetical protein